MQKLLLIFLAVYSLSLVSCKPGPKLTVCIVNAAKSGFDCYDETTGESSFLTLEQGDKYVALSPQDTQTLINYCGAPK